MNKHTLQSIFSSVHEVDFCSFVNSIPVRSKKSQQKFPHDAEDFEMQGTHPHQPNILGETDQKVLLI